MELGEKLSLLRKQRGMTQMELAEALDISRQAVSRWEQGVSEPSTANLIRMGQLFGVPVDALVNGGTHSPPEADAQAAEANPEETNSEETNQEETNPEETNPEETNPEEVNPEAPTPKKDEEPPQVIPPKPKPRRWLVAAVCAGMVCTLLLGMLAGAMLMGYGTASAGSVSFGNVGLTINGRTALQAGEVTTDDKGCEIPSAITYTDKQGGGTTYVPIRTFSELLDIPVAWEDGMVYLGYMPSPNSGLTISDGGYTGDLPLHRAGSKAGPYTEVEPYWPSEDEIDQVLLNKPMKSPESYLEGGNWRPVKDEGYFSLSITNTTGRDLVLGIQSPATITTDAFPDTVVPEGETVVRTFHVAPYTGGLSPRQFTFDLRGAPLSVDGDSPLSATVWLVSFTPQ